MNGYDERVVYCNKTAKERRKKQIPPHISFYESYIFKFL